MKWMTSESRAGVGEGWKEHGRRNERFIGVNEKSIKANEIKLIKNLHFLFTFPSYINKLSFYMFHRLWVLCFLKLLLLLLWYLVPNYSSAPWQNEIGWERNQPAIQLSSRQLQPINMNQEALGLLKLMKNSTRKNLRHAIIPMADLEERLVGKESQANIKVRFNVLPRPANN